MVELQPKIDAGLFASLCAANNVAPIGARPRRDHLTLVQWMTQCLPPILSARLFHTFIEQRWERAGRPFISRTITGALYRYRTGDGLGDKVRMCGYWDWRNLAIAATLCAPGDRIIEIGANTGTETVGFAKLVGPRGSVCAFEPEPTLLQALCGNVQVNGFANVLTLGAAVADRSGSVGFSRPSSFDNSGVGHIAAPGDDAKETLQVPVVTLDSIADDLGPASLIAVDVEGYEVSVLRGAHAYLRRFRPALVLEVCPALLKRTGDDLMQLTAQLDALDYVAYEIGKFGISAVRSARANTAGYEANWLCMPRERAGVSRELRAMFLRCALTPNIGGFHPLSRIARGRS